MSVYSYFLNGIGASKVGLLTSTFLFHIIAGLIVFFIERIKNGKKKLIFKFPFVYYIPGILSVIIVALNSTCIENIGLSLVIGISMFGQLMFSGIIDHYGLLNMPKRKFGKNKVFWNFNNTIWNFNNEYLIGGIDMMIFYFLSVLAGDFNNNCHYFKWKNC